MKDKTLYCLMAAGIIIFLVIFSILVYDMYGSTDTEGYILSISMLSSIFSLFIILCACVVIKRRTDSNELYKKKFIDEYEDRK